MSGVTGALSQLTKVYDSGDQAIAQAGTLSLTHGLGAAPKVIQCFVRCASAEYGYSINDLLAVNVGTEVSTGPGGYNVSVVAGATTIVARYANTSFVFVANNKTTGDVVELTNASWRFVVRAYA